MPRTDIPMSAADELAKAVLAFKQSEKGAYETLVSLIEGLQAPAGTVFDEAASAAESALSAETQDEVEVAAALEALRRAVSDARPLPEHLLPDEAPIPPREWLLDGWLPAGRVALFTGKQGWGKSNLAFMLATAMAAGEPKWLIPFDDQLANEGEGLAPCLQADGDVVWATWEDEPAELRRRYEWNRQMREEYSFTLQVTSPKRLVVVDLAGFGPLWAPGEGSHVSARASLTATGTRLRSICKRVKARLLVIDPLAAAYASDENNRGLVRSYMSDWDRWSRATGCATLMIAHPPKGRSGEDNATYSGSTDWEAAARTAWHLGEEKEKVDGKETHEPEKCLSLNVTKANYAARPPRIWLRKEKGLYLQRLSPTWWKGDRT